MKSLDELRDEHDGIKLMLNILQSITQQAERSEKVDTNHVAQIMEFITVFVDKCHHGKEEELLFPSLVEMGVMNENGPVGVMLSEHEEGRKYVREMLVTLNQYKNGDKEALEVFCSNAHQYIDMLRAHIKDDELIEGFELIERERVGEGKHEQFHKMLHTLKSYYL